MGCHISKQARRDLHRSPSPLSRCRSLPDTDHIVSLTSSTPGSLLVVTKENEEKQSNGDDKNRVLTKENEEKQSNGDDKNRVLTKENEEKQSNGDDKNRVLPFELAKAKVWSDMIDCKIPKAPTETPPNKPEPIDALELMAGFHGDYSPFDRRPFSFYPIGHLDDRVLESLPKSNLSNASPILETHSVSDSSSSSSSEVTEKTEQSIKKNMVVFYFTTLRGIRKTFDDCCIVKTILREYGVRIDERDVSMHAGFKEELKDKTREGNYSLPRVFIDEKELGGAEEVKRLHESGKLDKVLEGCVLDLKEKGETGEMICPACGDVRFVLCGNCSGSCRVYVDVDDEDGGGGEWRRCSDCNENGVVRCPVCCYIL